MGSFSLASALLSLPVLVTKVCSVISTSTSESCPKPEKPLA